MHLVQLLLAASLIAATTAAPLLNQEVITETQHRACVYGAPKKYDHWTIHYHEVKPPSQFPMRFVLDPAWVARHQNVGDADVSFSFTCARIHLQRLQSDRSSTSLWVLPGSRGLRTGASTPATRERNASLGLGIKVISPDLPLSPSYKLIPPI